MASLAGKTLFISGANRGIGKAIALRAARDGANIVIAAKTAVANPKLPGTIHDAAAEIEAAGGRALPLVVDIRFGDHVYGALAQAVARFRGTRILVNNPTPTTPTSPLQTPHKPFPPPTGPHLHA